MKREKYSTIAMKLAGLILLAAGIAKIFQLLTVPDLGEGFFESRLFLSLGTAAELGLALWLFSGIFKKTAWLVTLLSFVFFLVTTLYRGFIGAASCGCFGNVEVNPWLTIFAFIVPVMFLLLVFRNKRWKWFNIKSKRYFAIWLVFGAIVVSGVFGYLMANEPAKVTENYAVLQPDKWVGEEFGLFGQIDIGDYLRDGKWIIMLYRHDCSECHEAMLEYSDLANELADAMGRPVFALVEMPPYEDEPIVMEGSYIEGQLTDEKEWFVATPVMVVIEDGFVLFSSEGIVVDEEELRGFFAE